MTKKYSRLSSAIIRKATQLKLWWFSKRLQAVHILFKALGIDPLKHPSILQIYEVGLTQTVQVIKLPNNRKGGIILLIKGVEVYYVPPEKDYFNTVSAHTQAKDIAEVTDQITRTGKRVCADIFDNVEGAVKKAFLSAVEEGIKNI